MQSMEEEKKGKDYSRKEIAEQPPSWVKETDMQYIRESVAIKEVIDFFVIYSPCANVSARGRDLTHYHWKEKNPQKGKYLYEKILVSADLFENETLFVDSSLSDTKSLFLRAEMRSNSWTDYTTNRIALVSSGNLIMDIFRIIRNCLAHGRFTIIPSDDDYIIAMENGEAFGKEKEGKSFEVKARLILKLSTMKEWIRIIKEDYIKAEKEEKKHEIDVENALLDVIRAENYSKFADLISKVSFSESETEAAKRRLIDRGTIEYSRSKRCWIILSEE